MAALSPSDSLASRIVTLKDGQILKKSGNASNEKS